MSYGSVRINISLSKKCMEKIDELITVTHLFNGKSDFVAAAIRCLIIDIDGQKKKNHDISSSHFEKETNEIWESQINGYLLDIEKRYEKFFSGPNTSQISIRLSKNIIDYINGEYLHNSFIDTAHFIRLSIVHYCDYISDHFR